MDAATPSALSPNAEKALTLPFTAEALLASMRPWVEQESPTFDATAVNGVMSLAMREMALLGARVERIPGRMGLGDCVRARFAPPGAPEGGTLILAHLDTVHPVGTLATGLPFRVEGDRAFGPGLYDMKGGTVLALQALAALAKAGIATSRPVTVLLTSDEEIGSPSTRDLIEAEASPPPGGAGAGARACRARRGQRPLRHRPLQPARHRQAQPCRRPLSAPAAAP
jgi:glutamate carboxypeptidase